MIGNTGYYIQPGQDGLVIHVLGLMRRLGFVHHGEVSLRIISEPIGQGGELIQFDPLNNLLACQPSAGLHNILDVEVCQVVGAIPLHGLG